mgnify:CR=1 FL=1
MKRILIFILTTLLLTTGTLAQKATKKDGSKIVIGYTFHSAQDVFQNGHGD